MVLYPEEQNLYRFRDGKKECLSSKNTNLCNEIPEDNRQQACDEINKLYQSPFWKPLYHIPMEQ
jgi:hypothetical protein